MRPTQTPTSKMTIDVWADLACPWCYVGEARLAAALKPLGKAFPDLDVRRRWRPFQLQPQLPSVGQPWRAFAARKFGGLERAAAAFEHVTEAGAQHGLEFDFERMPKAPNTAAAHALLVWAGSQPGEPESGDHHGDAHDGGPAAWRLADALFRAYFSEARDVTLPSVLADVAAGAGYDRAEARRAAESQRYREAVAESQREAARLGITGVPCYVIDQKYAISGAQPAADFYRALYRIAEASAPAT